MVTFVAPYIVDEKEYFKNGLPKQKINKKISKT